MKNILFVFIVQFRFTIDRIENGWLIAEWDNQALTTLWKGHVVNTFEEGEQGIATLKTCEKSNVKWMNQDPLMIQKDGRTSVIPFSFPTLNKKVTCIEFLKIQT